MIQILGFPKALPLVVLRGAGEIEIPRRVFATFVPTKVGKILKKKIFSNYNIYSILFQGFKNCEKRCFYVKYIYSSKENFIKITQMLQNNKILLKNKKCCDIMYEVINL